LPGICTDYGCLSHAAIVAREYGIPAVVGSPFFTKKFKDGDIVRIDSSTGKTREKDGLACCRLDVFNK
jgi:phosphohistidine swiveling domain-containing protein